MTVVTLIGADHPSWRFKLIWWHHGADAVIWKSRHYTGRTSHCGPVREPTEGRDPKFFDRVVLFGGNADSATGFSDIYTGF